MIVVGVDYSEGSADALRVAREIAAREGEPVRLIHVDVGGGPDEVSHADREAWLHRLSVGASEVEHRRGVPWVELVRVVAERDARLVVTGTHGKSGFQPLRLGTTAANVALRSGRPVLLVPPRRDGMNMDSSNRGRKMKSTKRSLILGMVFTVALSASACSKKPAPVAPAPTNDRATSDDEAARARREAEERARREAEARAAEEAAQREMTRKRTVLEAMVFFDYDEASIRSDAKRTLDDKAGILRQDGSIRLRVFGHADERGSTEYNLALGMRRAQSIREYLAGFGISADRLEIQSLGEERPLANGHDEAAWGRNRRGEFSILAVLRAGG